MRHITDQDLKNVYQPVSDDFQKVMRRTLSSLSEREEKSVMKKKLSIGLIAAIVALLGLLSAAMAGSFLKERTINWRGEVMEEEIETSPMSTFTPEPAAIMEEALLAERAQKLIGNGNENDFHIAYWLDENGQRIGQTAKKRRKTIQSYEMLVDILGKNADFTLPSFIPEGYKFEEAEIYLEYPAGEVCERVDTWKDPSGIIVDCYAADPERDVIVGYEATFLASAPDHRYLYIRGDLSADNDLNDYMFGLGENEEGTTVYLPGTESALMITGDQQCKLIARKKLSSSIDTISIMSFLHPEDGIQTNRYTEEIINIWGPQLTEEDALAMYSKE